MLTSLFQILLKPDFFTKKKWILLHKAKQLLRSMELQGKEEDKN